MYFFQIIIELGKIDEIYLSCHTYCGKVLFFRRWHPRLLVITNMMYLSWNGCKCLLGEFMHVENTSYEYYTARKVL